ncbi:MAG: hypothetical protein Q9216_006715 [Gyalolechia sp. 2 TL-2023]
MGLHQPLLLPPSYHNNAAIVTFNPHLRRLHQGELIFLVLLRKHHNQPFHHCTLALQKLRRAYHNFLQAASPPTELYLPSDDELQTLYSFLREGANIVDTPGLPSNPKLIEAADIFHYWENMWQNDQTPWKTVFWENWRATQNAYHNAIGVHLHAKDMENWLYEHATPSFVPTTTPFHHAPGPNLPAPHFNPWLTDHHTATFPNPSLFLYQPPTTIPYWFSAQEMDFIVAVRLQWVLDYPYLAHMIRRTRERYPRDLSNPLSLAEAVSAITVQKACESLPQDCLLVQKWGRPIRQGDACWPQYYTFWALMCWGIDSYRREKMWEKMWERRMFEGGR